MQKASLVQDQVHQDLASQVALLLLQSRQRLLLNRCFIYTYVGVCVCVFQVSFIVSICLIMR
jgi:hypothetical protein